jgi:hypothetical protein
MSGLPIQIDSLPADYHTLVYPTVAGVTAYKLRANANTGALVELRYTLLSDADDVLAAQRLATGGPDCRLLMPGETEVIDIETAGGYLYLLPVAFGGTDAGANGIVDSSAVTNDNGGATVGAVAITTITQAQILAATSQIRLDWSTYATVRQMIMSFGDLYDSSKRAVISIEGASHA